MAKTGRKSRPPYRDSNGNDHLGLYRRPDGRFAASGNPNKTFGNVETEAVRRFYDWQSKERGDRVAIHETSPPTEGVKKDWKHWAENHPEPAARDYYAKALTNNETVKPKHVQESAYWARVADDIRKRPKLVSQKTGIEQVGYLSKLTKPPEPLTLAEIGAVYYGEGGKAQSADTLNRAKKAWADFCKAVSPATTVEDIEGEHFRCYEQKVRRATYVDKKTKKRRRYDEKTVSHRFNIVGSILREAWLIKKEHRAAIHELQIEFRQFCKNKHNREGNPTPIDPEDFAAIFRAANIKWRAALLCMLNFAAHPNECIHIKKRHLDMTKKTYDDKRKKKGHYRRVAAIWDETIAAIEAYQATQIENAPYQEGEYLFMTDNKGEESKPYGKSGATYYFRETLKPKAEREIGRKITVTLDSIRDGAQNAADDGGADSIHTMMLMGHALPGTTGAYKNRQPYKTAKSVECIYEHYGISELVGA